MLFSLSNSLCRLQLHPITSCNCILAIASLQLHSCNCILAIASLQLQTCNCKLAMVNASFAIALRGLLLTAVSRCGQNLIQVMQSTQCPCAAVAGTTTGLCTRASWMGSQSHVIALTIGAASLALYFTPQNSTNYWYESYDHSIRWGVRWVRAYIVCA